jgi:hypothetical protein
MTNSRHSTESGHWTRTSSCNQTRAKCCNQRSLDDVSCSVAEALPHSR